MTDTERARRLLAVTQIDRDAAADLRMLMPPLAGSKEIAAMRDGALDDGAYVQAFARHRLAAHRAGLEDAARIAEEYYCATCGQFFYPSVGHYDEECPKGRASWGGQRNADDIAFAIRRHVTTCSPDAPDA